VPRGISSASRSRNGARDKIEGLDAGADDHVINPFGIGELLARARVALVMRTAWVTRATSRRQGVTQRQLLKEV
jgi:DNA-binding response OmpR family regulator